MASKHAKKIQSLIGVAVSLALIVWMALKIDWSQVGTEMQKIQYILLIPCVLITIVHTVFRCWRWCLLLPTTEIKKPSIAKLFDALMIGNLATFILPLRAGEFIRPYVLSLKSEVPFATGFVSIIIERFFDLAAVLLTFGALVFFIPGIPDGVVKGAAALSCVAGAIFIAILLAAFFPAQLERLARFFARYLPKPVATFGLTLTESFIGGAHVLSNPLTLFGVLFGTLLVWGSTFALFYVYVDLVGVVPSITLAVAIAVILALAVAAPSMPGFIGVYQVGCIWAFNLFNHSDEVGITFAIVTHIFQYAVLVLYGGISFLCGGLTMSHLTRREHVL
jgi:uncharacterized protein (TIRG00374 family)